MAGINPTSGVMPPVGPNPTAAPSAPTTSGQAPDFAKMLRGYVEQVDQAQHESTAAIQDLLTGKVQDPLPVVAAVAKADLSFKLLLGVRNKVIEAYKQTMNMQI